MADMPQTEVLIGSKVRELEQVGEQAERLDISIAVESSSGEEHTFRLVTHGPNQWVGAEYGSQRLYKQSVSEAIVEVAKPIRGFSLRVVSVTARGTKCSLPNKELKRLAVDAWCEAIAIQPPSDADIKKEEAKKKSRQQELKATLLADLTGGAEGLERWKGRGAEREVVKHLRESDLQGANLTEAQLYKMRDFRGSNFEGCLMERADLSQCDIRECNFMTANLAKARLRYANATSANFSGACLTGTYLLGSDLSSANLEGCDMTGADLSQADLRGAILRGAVLKDIKFSASRYDEHTVWPPDFAPPEEGLNFEGQGKDPFLIAKVKALAPDGKVDFETFVAKLEKEFDRERLKKSLSMLKAERFQLFAEVKSDSVVGVVKSQTNPDLVYSCLLSDTGAFSCCTQNLFPCGGLRGSLCKHLLVLLIGLTKAGELDASTGCQWVLASQSRSPKIDKEVMSATFLRYKGAEAGEIDWRPTETLPEDYYAF